MMVLMNDVIGCVGFGDVGVLCVCVVVWWFVKD